MKTYAQLSLSIFALISCLLMTSCVSSQQVSHQGKSSPQHVNNESCWYQVRQDPPVFYPVGVPKDAVTDYRHGEWIAAGNDGALWFVPFGGARGNSAGELTRQALAMRTDKQRNILRREKVREAVFATIGTVALTTTTVATTAGQALGSQGHAVMDPGATWNSYGDALDESPLFGALGSLQYREDLYLPETISAVSRGPARPGSRANEDQSVSSLNKEADTLLLEDARGAVEAKGRPMRINAVEIGDPASLPNRPQ
jgi:hypothetical protein